MAMTRKNLGIVIMIAAAAVGRLQAQEAGQLARETAKEYLEQARYPESSRALKRGEEDPIRAKRQVNRVSRRGPDSAEPTLSLWTAKVSFEKGQPVDLFATLETQGKALTGGAGMAGVAAVTGEIVDDSGAILTEVAYRDDGHGVWSARLSPEGLGGALAASYMVRVRARLASGDLREASGGFLYSDPAAHLTGRYRDFLREGDLVIAAEVEVAEAGRFHLAGTLYAKSGEPLGTAQAASQLEPGRRWIELPFYGLMFHDRAAAGPYKLGTLALATTHRMPNALNDLVMDAYVTRPYRLQQMRDVPFERPALVEAAKRLKLDAERAQREARKPEQQ
jgi:uncharacterized protein DUF4784